MKIFLTIVTTVWIASLVLSLRRFWRVRAGGWDGLDGKPVWPNERPRAYWWGLAWRCAGLVFETAFAIILVFFTVSAIRTGYP